jgi:hypothetical protein
VEFSILKRRGQLDDFMEIIENEKNVRGHYLRKEKVSARI